MSLDLSSQTYEKKLSKFNLSLIKKTTLKDDLFNKINLKKDKLKQLKKQLKRSDQALLIIQAVAKQTQEQLQYKISELVTLALASVFPDPYKMKLIYEIKRNKTEARMIFEKNGRELDPLTSTGGGVVDVASFALRLTLLSLSRSSFDNVIILDEPWKNLNDPTRSLHRKMAQMVKEIQRRLGTQVIVVSQIPELEDIADKTFEVSQVKGISKLEEI